MFMTFCVVLLVLGISLTAFCHLEIKPIYFIIIIIIIIISMPMPIDSRVLK